MDSPWQQRSEQRKGLGFRTVLFHHLLVGILHLDFIQIQSSFEGPVCFVEVVLFHGAPFGLCILAQGWSQAFSSLEEARSLVARRYGSSDSSLNSISSDRKRYHIIYNHSIYQSYLYTKMSTKMIANTADAIQTLRLLPQCPAAPLAALPGSEIAAFAAWPRCHSRCGTHLGRAPSYDSHTLSQAFKCRRIVISYRI